MKDLEWRSESDFTVDGVSFQCAVGDYSGRTNEERFMLLKDRTVLDQYAAVLGEAPPRRMLEFGVFQGGSPVLFSLWFGLDKFVGVDICKPVAAFDEFCRRHNIGRKIRTYYEISQTDRARIEQIVRTEFGATPLDVVIDDASHLYRLSRKTFEIAFPLLRPGGVYVIEDWGWAHWPPSPSSHSYSGHTPLSKLVMEILMLSASRPDLVSEVRVFPAFAFIRKSPDAQPVEDFKLAKLYNKRGLEIVGARDMDLGAVARLAAARAAGSVRRQLQKLRRRERRR